MHKFYLKFGRFTVERDCTIPYPQYIELLVRLGLTFTEAKIFLVLCLLGTATAKMISENAGVAREVVYQVIPRLQKKDLVQTILSAPQKYRAVSPEDALTKLSKQIEDENKKTQRAIRDCIRTLKRTPQKPPNDFTQTVIVPKGKTATAKITDEIKLARASVQLIISWQKFSRWRETVLRDIIQVIGERKIKLQIIAERRAVFDGKFAPASFKQFEKDFSTNFELRIAANQDLINIVIIDQNRAFVDVEPRKDLKDAPFLYTNNPCLAPLALSYFEKNWNQAIELNPKMLIGGKEFPEALRN